MQRIAAAMVLMTAATAALADVRLDIKNESSQDCSVAVNARTDKTNWTTIGWYVYMTNEEAPIIVDGAANAEDIYIYHDCNLVVQENDETKQVWVRKSQQFKDDLPRDNAKGYEEVTFVRLKSDRYSIK